MDSNDDDRPTREKVLAALRALEEEMRTSPFWQELLRRWRERNP